MRLKRLALSVEKFNVERIPFYVSTPDADKALFDEVLGDEATFIWVSDESIVRANPNADFILYQSMLGGLSQQIVKSEFWRLGISENYVCLDSDSVFIRDFRCSDFIGNNGEPYTVIHQNKDFFQMASNRRQLKVEKDLRAESVKVMDFFSRQGPVYYCAPSPFIWSSKVWRSLDENLLIPAGITIWEFIKKDMPESLVYGETLLKYRAIRLLPIEPIFRVYHYDWQYYLLRRIGETQARLIDGYLGVIYQSTWQSEMHLGGDAKPFFSRALKKIKRIYRYMQSFT
ncbi:DUF6492 domain-containing protein [Polynucleobacter brandtiae]